MKRRRSVVWLPLLLVASLMLVQCAPATTPAVPVQSTNVPSQAETPQTAATSAPSGQEVTTLRFTWFTDGPDEPAIRKQVAAFEAQNPDIRIEFTLVPYADLNQLLEAQGTAGEAPDVVRVSEPPRFYKFALDISPYLKDPKAFSSQYLEMPMKLISGSKGEIYGIPHDFTVNGPFVNLSLFEKAGISLPTEKCVSWETWADLASRVRDATGVPFAIAVDRSGHRLDGFVQSYGGGFFTEDGAIRIDTPETRRGLQSFVDLHTKGVIPLDVWVGSGGSYAGANQYFVNGQLVFYISGNWQVAQFDKAIGDKFKWTSVYNGCYNGVYGGMPGGKFIMALKNNRNTPPEKVARLISFLGGKESMTQYAQDALFLPTRNDLIAEGIKYPVQNEVMNVFLQGIPLLPKGSYADNYHPKYGPVANEVRDRITQVLAGEISFDKAIQLADTRAKELISQ